jgi:riboflavin kinase/FMN adenylyltransferase
MQIHYNLDQFHTSEATITTIGSFDGVHLGHKSILNRLTELGQLLKLPTCLITFWPHPKKLLQPNPIELLNTLDEKISLLRSFNITHLIVLPFSDTLKAQSADDFIQEILIKKLHTKHLVIGYDHRFGNNREGDIHFLNQHKKKYGIQTVEISKQEIDNATISSTAIREHLKKGEIEIANKILGYPYLLSGVVSKGQQLGRTIQFPTANLSIETEEKLIPAHGVYVVRVYVGHRHYCGMMNIGMRPTVNGIHRTIEVHILEFNEDIYEKNIRMELLHYLRAEQKFTSIDALKAQLETDKINTNAYFKNII